MRVLIISPTVFPTVSGNAATAERWRSHLGELGVEASVLAAQRMETSDLEAALGAFRPDVLHVHHAYRAGKALWGGEGLVGTLPLVLSPGGTDLNLDWDSRERNELMKGLVARAKFLIVQSPQMEARVLECWGQAGSKLVRVPKACAFFGDEPYDLRAAAQAAPDDLIFFLPAGIRPVKGNLEWLLAMEKLHRLRPNIKAVSAGPILDSFYGRAFLEQVKRLQSFARWIGVIPPGAMKAAYKGADVVANSSFSEGLSNALIEAVSQGKPVLATDIPGNRWPVVESGGPDPCGILYDPYDPQDMVEKALPLVDEQYLRQKFSRAGLERSPKLGAPMEEARLLAEIYQKALEG